MRGPCHRLGEPDCEKRHPGCQAQCPKYKTFRAALDAAAEERRRATAGAEYAAEGIFKRRYKTPTKDVLRVISQR